MSVTRNGHLTLGSDEAKVKVEVFLNLACPYCASFYELVDEVLNDYLDSNRVQFIVKHYDKPREMLLPGTLINLNLDYSTPSETLQHIKSLFREQDTWDKYSNHEIKKMLQNDYALREEEENIEISLNVTAEAIERGVKMVPTVFINELEFQYPQEIGAEQLKKEIEKRL